MGGGRGGGGRIYRRHAELRNQEMLGQTWWDTGDTGLQPDADFEVDVVTPSRAYSLLK